jgi:hypothetical protein
MLRWEQKLLAQRSGVSLATIKRIEAQIGYVMANRPTFEALLRAFTAGGIVFTNGGVSYRLKRIGDRVISPKGEIVTVIDVESEPQDEGDGNPMIQVRFQDRTTRWFPQFFLPFATLEDAKVDEA